MKKSTLITAICLLSLILLLALIAGLSGYQVFTRISTLLLINLILVQGLQVFMGNSGILSFAHIAFMAIGAYASSVFSIPLQMRSMVLPDLYEPVREIVLSPISAILFGGPMATLIAALVSYPLMRLADAAAVITSFALPMVIYTITVNWSEVTNGPPTLFGVPGFTTLPIAALVAAVAVLAALAFRQTRTGLLLRALRDDELAAVAMGAHPSRIRWRGLVASALFAGIAGGLWAPFRQRMREVVITNTERLLSEARAKGIEVMFARIACQKENGRDRSLSQKKPGWNYLLLPKDTEDSALVPELQPVGDEIVFCKTTDSLLTGTNARLILQNMGIRKVVVAGIFTDQCIASTVRSLADESFDVVVVEDCCAATKELHDHELEIINMIYCQVASLEESLGFIT